ncbi:hypothetical protein [Jatrophihabitans sp.]|uniref:COG4315 family predicted lipoprotein n=1 Tax=Jatrophihabitans sp. TaxID=1932789 RepID=UPI002BBF043C|nr:hypothetical protein [Jatrophihabitans sp.]
MRAKIAVGICAAVLIGGCGSAGDSAAGDSRTSVASSGPSVGASSVSASTTRTPGPSGTAQPGAVITLASSRFGPVLFDASGQAIYLFDADKAGEPTCYDDCAGAWPPVLTKGRPVARGGIHAQLLGTTTRRDGSAQVTYGGKPLYFYAHEGKNVVLCHNIREFGGLWLAVTRTGTPAPT